MIIIIFKEKSPISLIDSYRIRKANREITLQPYFSPLLLTYDTIYLHGKALVQLSKQKTNQIKRKTNEIVDALGSRLKGTFRNRHARRHKSPQPLQNNKYVLYIPNIVKST